MSMPGIFLVCVGPLRVACTIPIPVAVVVTCHAPGAGVGGTVGVDAVWMGGLPSLETLDEGGFEVAEVVEDVLAVLLKANGC